MGQSPTRDIRYDPMALGVGNVTIEPDFSQRRLSFQLRRSLLPPPCQEIILPAAASSFT